MSRLRLVPGRLVHSLWLLVMIPHRDSQTFIYGWLQTHTGMMESIQHYSQRRRWMDAAIQNVGTMELSQSSNGDTPTSDLSLPKTIPPPLDESMSFIRSIDPRFSSMLQSLLPSQNPDLATTPDSEQIIERDYAHIRSKGQKETTKPPNEQESMGALFVGNGLLSWFDVCGSLAVWYNALRKGRLPVQSEFVGPDRMISLWPPEPLYSSVSRVMSELQLPRFLLRYPTMIPTVLITVLRMALEYHNRLALQQYQGEDNQQSSEVQVGGDLDTDNDEQDLEQYSIAMEQREWPQTKEDVANQVVDSFLKEQFAGVIPGVGMLDMLFGYNHQLLDVEQDSDGYGFGIDDGIWQHSGWKQIPPLQRELASMTELKSMIKELGRRPTAKGRTLERFMPRKTDPNGADGAHWDPWTRTSVNGLTLSDNLAEMIPSEAILLKGSSTLRRLFMAKRVESKLLSYDRSWYSDVPSAPHLRRRRWTSRFPSAPGGPVIVCLDTSWSMSGRREALSKAVVLASVSAAYRQKRDCLVVSFSTEQGVMDCGTLSADKSGIKNLLEFLSHSFHGGGTDVTGALKFAVQELGSDTLSAADILLVTDGEIPDPPVSDKMMAELNQLKLRTGMKIYGLLVGKGESRPLSKLCEHVYDFLVGYDSPHILASPTTRNRVTLNAIHSTRIYSRLNYFHRGYRLLRHRCGWYNQVVSIRTIRNRSSTLWAKFSEDDLDWKPRKPKVKYSKASSKFDDDSRSTDAYRNELGGESIQFADRKDLSDKSQYTALVAAAFDKVEHLVNQKVEQQQVSIHDRRVAEEALTVSTTTSIGEQLRSAINIVSENLVERAEDSRIVVLAVASGEHVLLLGPPGTGKSELGRRVSKVCQGAFFQRLLTRFTTPEEIFGPLSLKALENDEYVRRTEGFLPTASVAFLDEIFKANSAILNTLLTILNERQFDNGAGRREDCPIRCVVGASNELPETDELDALYDRFLLRKEVTPVSDEGILELLSMAQPGSSSCDTGEKKCDALFSNGFVQVIDILSRATETVTMDPTISILIRDLRTFLREKLDADISDRRLIKACKLLKLSAASHGRYTVEPIDCLLLQHIAWQRPEQRAMIREWLWENLIPGSAQATSFQLILDGLRLEAMQTVRSTGGDVTGRLGARQDQISAVAMVRDEVAKMVGLLAKELDRFDRHMKLLSNDHIWLDPEELTALRQLQTPKAKQLYSKTMELLEYAFVLEISLDPALVDDNLRVSLLEKVGEELGTSGPMFFTDSELRMDMREAKKTFAPLTFRAWRRARKKAGIT